VSNLSVRKAEWKRAGNLHVFSIIYVRWHRKFCKNA